VNDERSTAIAEFLRRTGWADAERRPLAGDASFRRYERLRRGDQRVVLMDAPPPMETVQPFLRIGRHLVDLGYSAPRILAEDSAQGLLLLEDLGDDTYTRLLARGVDEADLYGLAIDLLIDLHGRGGGALAPGVPGYDDARLLREAGLLLDWYYPEMIGGPAPDDVRADYLELWRGLLPVARAVPDTLVLFDFHVDNLMRLDGRPGVAACGLLDFQDAVAGPLTYDLMSLLEDARRDIDADLIATLRARYLDHFPALSRTTFDASWAVMAAQRHCRVIGVFTRLCRRDGKPGYLAHISRCWRLLSQALTHPALTPLAAWFDRHLPPSRRGVPIP
jgi:aminoglycoside/choline kinase family phosphotransferase